MKLIYAVFVLILVGSALAMRPAGPSPFKKRERKVSRQSQEWRKIAFVLTLSIFECIHTESCFEVWTEIVSHSIEEMILPWSIIILNSVENYARSLGRIAEMAAKNATVAKILKEHFETFNQEPDVSYFVRCKLEFLYITVSPITKLTNNTKCRSFFQTSAMSDFQCDLPPSSSIPANGMLSA